MIRRGEGKRRGRKDVRRNKTQRMEDQASENWPTCGGKKKGQVEKRVGEGQKNPRFTESRSTERQSPKG